MPDYQNGKIYELVCRVTGKRYIGSTTQPLSKRLHQHKKEADRKYKCRSSEIVVGGDYYINLLRSCPVNTKEELHTEERKEFDKGDCINNRRPTRTDQERKDWDKQYYQDHKEEYKEYAKQYHQDHKEYAKQYYQNNREKINEYIREWRKKKREEARV
jgi:selenocysteine-specific translation elongation factor